MTINKLTFKSAVILSVMLLSLPTIAANASEGHEATAEAGHEGEGAPIKIDPKLAEEMGITVKTVGNGVVHKSVVVTGKILQNQNTTAEVKARFEGIVKSVSKTQGEVVLSGETLAMVESNSSLEVYPVRAPVGGTIIARNVNVGHVTGGEPLFVIADLSKLWAELYVFPKDASLVKTGATVVLQSATSEQQSESVVKAILPVVDDDSQTVIARVEVENPSNEWRPGMSIRANILVDSKEVPTSIDADAPQKLDGKMVVFVEEDGAFSPREVKLGISDQKTSEVISGVQTGDNYVAKGSFILKADVEKAGAEHED